MPRAITCVNHGKWKVYWTGWRHVRFDMLILIGQWYAVSHGGRPICYASYPGAVGKLDCEDHLLEVCKQRGQIEVLPSTPYKVKCKIKQELLFKLTGYLDELES